MAIKQKPNGKYLVDIRDEYGTRIEKTFNTKTEAKAFEALYTKKKYEKQLISSKLKQERFLLAEELNHFEQTKAELRPSSIKRYKYVINQIRLFTQAIDITYVDEFTPDYATLFKEELMRERKDPKGSTNRVLKAKPKTVNFFLMTIKSFFHQEYIKGHIVRDPMVHIKNVRVERRKADYYSVPELKAFFAQPMHPAYKNAFMGLLLTGMRFAEMANLKWKNVNMTSKIIEICSDDGFITKTDNSQRFIPIGEDLCKLLEAMRKRKSGKDFVFCSPKGNKMRERSLLGKCKAVAVKAKISAVATLHKFRHTYATLLIHRGVPIQNIKELLGHSSIVQTEIYAHNKSDHMHSDVGMLDNLLVK